MDLILCAREAKDFPAACDTVTETLEDRAIYHPAKHCLVAFGKIVEDSLWLLLPGYSCHS